MDLPEALLYISGRVTSREKSSETEKESGYVKIEDRNLMGLHCKSAERK
jgi:hypothetical protein